MKNTNIKKHYFFLLKKNLKKNNLNIEKKTNKLFFKLKAFDLPSILSSRIVGINI